MTSNSLLVDYHWIFLIGQWSESCWSDVQYNSQIYMAAYVLCVNKLVSSGISMARRGNTGTAGTSKYWSMPSIAFAFMWFISIQFSQWIMNFRECLHCLQVKMWKMKSGLPLPVLDTSCCNISVLFQTFFWRNDDSWYRIKQNKFWNWFLFWQKNCVKY
mgnify:CR=1 FL=1